MISKIIVLVQIMLSLSLIFLIASCSSAELSRGKAESLLNRALQSDLERNASLNPILSTKAEFFSIKNERFFEYSTSVTGIHKTSENEADVDFNIVIKGKPEPLKKWLDAMNRLQTRLKTLKSNSWGIFQDPYDGQNFYTPYNNRTIEASNEWKELERLKLLCEEVYEKGSIETNPSKAQKAKFKLYDDGWRVVK
ncbi:MAG: hypothetical protein KJ963_06265 [Bacteroidetes bacterium]|nr:hypothetical protein [Bacteroidota bacterium]